MTVFKVCDSVGKTRNRPIKIQNLTASPVYKCNLCWVLLPVRYSHTDFGNIIKMTVIASDFVPRYLAAFITCINVMIENCSW